MAKKVKKQVTEEEENLRPESFPNPPLSKDARGKGPLETLSPTNTIILGMVVIIVGAVLAGLPWLFFNGEGVPLYTSIGGVIILLGGFLIYTGVQKEKWRVAVKEWLKTYEGEKLSSLKLPEWLEIEETKSKVPVLPPDGIIPTSPKLNTHNVEATHMSLPDLSDFEDFNNNPAASEEEVIVEEADPDPASLFKDEPAPNFDQFWDDSDDYDDFPTFNEKLDPSEDNAILPEIIEEGQRKAALEQLEDAELPDVTLPTALTTVEVSSAKGGTSTTPVYTARHSGEETPATSRDFLDEFLEEDVKPQAVPARAIEGEPTAEVAPSVEAPPSPVGACSACGHPKEDHSPTRGTCATCLMADDDELVCEAYKQ